jgi:hypothetical protein
MKALFFIVIQNNYIKNLKMCLILPKLKKFLSEAEPGRFFSEKAENRHAAYFLRRQISQVVFHFIFS